MSYARRIEEAITRSGLNDTAVAERLCALGYKAAHDRVTRWRKGKGLPSPDDLAIVAEALGSDAVWLATGRLSANTIDEDDATLLTVRRSLRLSIEEAIRRLSAATELAKSDPAHSGEPVSVKPILNEQDQEGRRSGTA